MFQVDAVTKDLYTALHIAAKEGKEEVIVHTKKRRGGGANRPLSVTLMKKKPDNRV